MGTECKEEYYCEYECDGKEWNLIDENTQEGYYCPADPRLPVPCEKEEIKCLDPIPKK